MTTEIRKVGSEAKDFSRTNGDKTLSMNEMGMREKDISLLSFSFHSILSCCFYL